MAELLNLKMHFAIIPTYAGILAFIYLGLTLRTIMSRGTTKIAIGAGGNRHLERRVRAHGNFSEYVPIILILLTFLELRGAPGSLLHVLGAVLILARLSHAYGISQEPENFKFRIAGMIPTMTILAISAGVNIYYSIVG